MRSLASCARWGAMGTPTPSRASAVAACTRTVTQPTLLTGRQIPPLLDHDPDAALGTHRAQAPSPYGCPRFSQAQVGALHQAHHRHLHLGEGEGETDALAVGASER